MLKTSRAVIQRLGQQASAYHRPMVHARFFAMVALLVPLFIALDHVVGSGVPQVEIRLVSRDVPVAVAIEVPVERVVERVVYVPVERQTAARLDPLQPASAGVILPTDEITEPSVAEAQPSDAETPAAPEGAVAEGATPDEATPDGQPASALALAASRPATAAAPRYVPPAPSFQRAPVDEPEDEAQDEVADAPEDVVAEEPEEVADVPAEEPWANAGAQINATTPDEVGMVADAAGSTSRTQLIKIVRPEAQPEAAPEEATADASEPEPQDEFASEEPQDEPQDEVADVESEPEMAAVEDEATSDELAQDADAPADDEYAAEAAVPEDASEDVTDAIAEDEAGEPQEQAAAPMFDLVDTSGEIPQS